MILQTNEDIHSSGSAQMKLGLLKSVKQYTNTSTVKATTGMPYYMTETMENCTLEEEYLK